MAHRIDILSEKFDFKKINSFFEIGGGFGSNIHLSYAIQKMLNEQRKLEASYLMAAELHDEKETKRLKRELDSYNSSIDYSLIVALEGLEDNA